MILRRSCLVLVALLLGGAIPPSASFQTTHAHFPSLHTINQQFQETSPISITECRRESVSARRTLKLRATTAVPPPPLSQQRGGKQQHRTPCPLLLDRSSTLIQQSQHSQQQQYHSNSNNHNGGGLHLFRPKRAEQLWLDEASYQRRKDEWASKYTSVDALRETFGASRNGVWGDLDAQTARRLYKTLLPKALLELYKMGVHPEDLAPLAYRARVAAKLYARERCSLPFRVAANLYDGFRQWRRYGSFDTHGMSFQQIWEKYSAVILEQSLESSEDLTSDDVTAKICLKILERSCATNEMVDNLVLRDEEGKQDLDHFTQTLEQDVRRLLQPVQEVMKPSEQELQRIRTLRRVARIRRRLNKSLHRNPNHHHQKVASPLSPEVTRDTTKSSLPPRTKFPWQNRSRPPRADDLGAEPQ